MERPPSAPRPAAGPEAFDLLYADTLHYFGELVVELGGQPAALLRKAGVRRAQSVARGQGISYRQAIELLELAAEHLRCPDFGMRLAMRQGGSAVFGPLGPVMRNSRSFGEALAYVATHNFAHSLAARIWLRSYKAQRAVFSGHDILLDRLPRKSQTMEQILLLGSLGAMDITGGYVRARKVHFRHQPLSPPETYWRYFRCETLFGQNEDGVFFSEQDMACPVLNPDPATYREATAHIDSEFTQHLPPLPAQVRGLIIRYLGTASCTNEAVAERLGLHPRRLHRHLTAEGTSFQKIKDEVRQDAMLYYIRHTGLEFSAISEKIGFAEPSVLTRFCRKWFGLPPTKLRAQARGV